METFPLSPSIFVAPDGSVFQSDGKNRQGEKDVVTDTVYVAGRYRPEIGECLAPVFIYVHILFVFYPHMFLS